MLCGLPVRLCSCMGWTVAVQLNRADSSAGGNCCLNMAPWRGWGARLQRVWQKNLFSGVML